MSMVVAKIDWRQLYTFASRQALLGFCFDGIERLTKEFSEELDRKSTRLNSSHMSESRMPSSA